MAPHLLAQQLFLCDVWSQQATELQCPISICDAYSFVLLLFYAIVYSSALDLRHQVLYVHCKHLNDFLHYHSLSIVYNKNPSDENISFMSLMSSSKSWLTRTNEEL